MERQTGYFNDVKEETKDFNLPELKEIIKKCASKCPICSEKCGGVITHTGLHQCSQGHPNYYEEEKSSNEKEQEEKLLIEESDEKQTNIQIPKEKSYVREKIIDKEVKDIIGRELQEDINDFSFIKNQEIALFILKLYDISINMEKEGKKPELIHAETMRKTFPEIIKRFDYAVNLFYSLEKQGVLIFKKNIGRRLWTITLNYPYTFSDKLLKYCIQVYKNPELYKNVK